MKKIAELEFAVTGNVTLSASTDLIVETPLPIYDDNTNLHATKITAVQVIVHALSNGTATAANFIGSDLMVYHGNGELTTAHTLASDQVYQVDRFPTQQNYNMQSMGEHETIFKTLSKASIYRLAKHRMRMVMAQLTANGAVSFGWQALITYERVLLSEKEALELFL